MTKHGLERYSFFDIVSRVLWAALTAIGAILANIIANAIDRRYQTEIDAILKGIISVGKDVITWFARIDQKFVDGLIILFVIITAAIAFVIGLRDQR